MIYTYTNLTFRITFKWYVFTFLVNTLFAAFFWSVSDELPFRHHFIFAQCQGFSILNFGAFAAQMIFRKAPPRLRLVTILVFTAIGSIAGKMLAPIILGVGPLSYQQFIFLMILNMMIVTIIIGFLYYWEGIAVTNSKIQEERKKHLDMEKKMAQTQLKLIRSQIDPGFLFNILNEVLSLLDTESEKAKSMQLSLIQYLRLSLFNFKKEVHTVSEEMDMISAYLNIRKAQSGNKMSSRIEAEESVGEVVIPTILLHSVVEKMASLEPDVINGSSISIRCCREDGGHFKFEAVRSGFHNSQDHELQSGFENIRYRLKKIFGDQGCFLIGKDESGNLKVVMTFAINLETAPANEASLSDDPHHGLKRLRYAFEPV